jgi:hypothetical protein
MAAEVILTQPRWKDDPHEEQTPEHRCCEGGLEPPRRHVPDISVASVRSTDRILGASRGVRVSLDKAPLTQVIW